MKKVETVTASLNVIADMLEPTIEALDLELWGIEHVVRGRSSLLRVYIDSEDGVTIDDCERASRQISAVLDVEDPLPGEYTLEVSSPGLDRPLFRIEQYDDFVGDVVSLRLRTPLEGRRKFKGLLESVGEDRIVMTVDNESVEIPFQQIEKANVVL